jgi:hypothetical protein
MTNYPSYSTLDRATSIVPKTTTSPLKSNKATSNIVYLGTSNRSNELLKLERPSTSIAAATARPKSKRLNSVEQ